MNKRTDPCNETGKNDLGGGCRRTPPWTSCLFFEVYLKVVLHGTQRSRLKDTIPHRHSVENSDPLSGIRRHDFRCELDMFLQQNGGGLGVLPYTHFDTPKTR